MISKWREAQIVRQLVAAVPPVADEDAHRKEERVGKYVGVCGKTIYNYQNADEGSRIGLNAFLRLVHLVGQSKPAEARQAMETLRKVVDVPLREEEERTR